MEVESRVVEPQTLVQRTDGLDLVLGQVKVGDLQVLLQAADVVGFWDDGDAPLGGPAEQDLGRGLAGSVGGLLDGFGLEQQGHLLGPLAECGGEFEEALRAEGRVGRHGDLVLLGQVDQARLNEVRVVLDLQGRDRVSGVGQNVVDGLSLGVGHADGPGNAGVDDLLEGFPGLVEGHLGGLDGLLLGVHPPSLEKESKIMVSAYLVRSTERVKLKSDGLAYRISKFLGLNIRKGDGEVDEVQIDIT